MAQRIVRAKRTLAEARVAFEVPRGAELAERLSSVLEVVYLIFNEGYSATAGDDWMRPQLSQEALRLGRVLAGAGARGAGGARPCRADGNPGVAFRRAHRPVRRADPAARPEPRALGPASDPPRPAARAEARRGARRARLALMRCRRASPPVMRGRGPRRRPIGRASWRSTKTLAEVVPSPVVELNRAVAVSMAYGPQAGLELVDELTGRADTQGLSSAAERPRRAFEEARAVDEARVEFERAASLDREMSRERELLLERAAATRA